MDTITNMSYGLSVALQPDNLVWSIFGVLVGNLIGVLPGIGVLTAISILLPLTYAMSPVAAMMMLAGIYYGAQYGGGITSILLNLPGTPTNVPTCLDGNPLARQGKAGSALFMLILSSFSGAIVGITILMLFAPLLAKVAYSFGPAEYFAMITLGLVAGSTLAKGSPVKSLAMVVLGLILGVVGVDVNTGVNRFTFGVTELGDGLSLIAMAMGLFGVADFLSNINLPQRRLPNTDRKGLWAMMRSTRPEPGDVRKAIGPISRGSMVGSALGVLPGTGSLIATFMAYAIEKKISRTPERFGRGAIEGVAAPEAANNSAAQTGFVPTLVLGIPGDPVMALMLGALILHGIQPGPALMVDNADIFWGLIASFFIGNVILVLVNLPLVGMWVKLLSIPYKYLFPFALLCVAIGVYSVNYSLVAVTMVIAFGVMGFVLRKMKFEAAPLLLGFVLGPMFEENFRRALLMSRGDLGVFFVKPISAGFLTVTILLLIWLIVSGMRYRKARFSSAAHRKTEVQ
ncbi:MAG: tripartite tricarboxylate transporter permease [Aquisalimonadaceae bacterium]